MPTKKVTVSKNLDDLLDHFENLSITDQIFDEKTLTDLSESVEDFKGNKSCKYIFQRGKYVDEICGRWECKIVHHLPDNSPRCQYTFKNGKKKGNHCGKKKCKNKKHVYCEVCEKYDCRGTHSETHDETIQQLIAIVPQKRQRKSSRLATRKK